MNWYRGNTHVHTTRSDGDSSPEQVVAGIRVIEAMVRANQSGRVEEVKVDSDRNGASKSVTSEAGSRAPCLVNVEN